MLGPGPNKYRRGGFRAGNSTDGFFCSLACSTALIILVSDGQSIKNITVLCGQSAKPRAAPNAPAQRYTAVYAPKKNRLRRHMQVRFRRKIFEEKARANVQS